MKITKLSNLIKQNPKKLISLLALNGKVKITGANFNEIPRNKILALLIFLLGNYQIEFIPVYGQKTKLFIFLVPIILIELIIEALMILLIPIFYSICLLIIIPLRIKKKIKNLNKKILYLRTDFLGYTKEGGSFAHVEGVIKGSQNLDQQVTLISSARVPSSAKKFILISYPDCMNFFIEIGEMAYSFKVFFKILLRPGLTKKFPSLIYQRHNGFNLSGVFFSLISKRIFILEVNSLEYWLRKNWGTLHFGLILKWAEKIILNKADLIVVVSDVLKQKLIKFGVSKEKILVNPNGVDEKEFNPKINGNKIKKELGLKQDLVVGFVSSFGPWHGIKVLTKAIPKVLTKTNRIKFLLIGEGLLKNESERFLNKYVKKGEVIFTGSIPHSQIPKYLACCDILVSPHVPNKDGSKFFGSPTKLFEYMAMAKPIIASDLEQIGQVLENNKTAILVPPSQAKILAKAINDLANNPVSRKKLGTTARKQILRAHTWTINAKNVLDQIKKQNQ